jgi:hypothetical protein
MTHPPDHADERFDALLREIGPDIPQPSPDEHTRARLVEIIYRADERGAGEPIGRSFRRAHWATAAGVSLAAVLGLACAVLWTNLVRAEDELVNSRWQTDEVLQLLVNARRTQPSIVAPERLEGLSSSDLVFITFHHDLCPLARPCTPKFKEMQQRHSDGPFRFITFDVTGSKRDSADQEIDALGMRFALLGPLGAETGVVKVLDATHQRVLCSAPGDQGLKQAEALLARVANEARQQ